MKFKPFLTGFWDEIEISQLIEDTRAHLPKDEKYKYWADRRLAELLVLVERLMPFGSIQIDRPQPTEIYVLTYKENGKRKVAFSFDGAPSAAYVPMISAVKYAQLEEKLLQSQREVAMLNEVIERHERRLGVGEE